MFICVCWDLKIKCTECTKSVSNSIAYLRLTLHLATFVNKRIDEYHDYVEKVKTQVFKPVDSTVDVRVAYLAIL